MAEQKDNWDKFERGAVGSAAIVGAIAAVAVPVVLGISANHYTAAMKQRELDARFAEVVLNILARPPASADSGERAIRQWAATIVERYTGVPFGDAGTKQILAGILPVGPKNGANTDTSYVVGFGPVTLEVIPADGQTGPIDVELNGVTITGEARDGPGLRFRLPWGAFLDGDYVNVRALASTVSPNATTVSFTYRVTGGERDLVQTLERPVGGFRLFSHAIGFRRQDPRTR